MKRLFEQNDMDKEVINDTRLCTIKQIEEDRNTIIATANDIKNNADKYAEVIFHRKPYIYTIDPELISFLPPKDDHGPLHTVTLEGLTNYLKWFPDQVIQNTIITTQY